MVEQDESPYVCQFCGEEADAATCWCGEATASHTNPMADGHSPVPIGCVCGYARTSEPADEEGSP